MIIEANPNNNPNKLHRIIVKHPAINVGKVKTVYEVGGEADKVMIESVSYTHLRAHETV